MGDIEVHNTTETEAARMAMLKELDGVPVEELQELIIEWEKCRLPREGSFEQASNCLEDLVEDYE